MDQRHHRIRSGKRLQKGPYILPFPVNPGPQPGALISLLQNIPLIFCQLQDLSHPADSIPVLGQGLSFHKTVNSDTVQTAIARDLRRIDTDPL